MVTTTARQRVLDVIGRRGSASASEIGRSLNMTATAVRHHLQILQADGRIVQQGSQPKRGRGRPEKVYRLSDRLLGENFAGLSEALLQAWLEEVPAARRPAALRALGESLAEQAGSLQPGLPPTRRLVLLAEKLSALGYQAHWEAGARGPRILLGHCPYAAIIDRHPELCVIDAAFVGRLLGAPVEQLARLDVKRSGATHCVFAMQEPAAPREG